MKWQQDIPPENRDLAESYLGLAKGDDLSFEIMEPNKSQDKSLYFSYKLIYFINSKYLL